MTSKPVFMRGGEYKCRVFKMHLKLRDQQLRGFPDGSDSKESACTAGDLGLIPGLGRAPGEGKSYPLQFWPGESHKILYSPWGCKELDTTERLSLF